MIAFFRYFKLPQINNFIETRQEILTTITRNRKEKQLL